MTAKWPLLQAVRPIGPVPPGLLRSHRNQAAPRIIAADV